MESFNARVRDELSNTGEFYTLHEATVLVADFQLDYNWLRPHSSFEDLAPALFAERWRTDHQPARLPETGSGQDGATVRLKEVAEILGVTTNGRP